jgi:hypothetical protein
MKYMGIIKVGETSSFNQLFQTMGAVSSLVSDAQVGPLNKKITLLLAILLAAQKKRLKITLS